MQIWVEAGELDYDCTCSLGAEGAFCKHCVAVGLSWLQNPGAIESHVEPEAEEIAAPKRSSRSMTTMQDVAGYLKSLNKDDLVRMVLDRAMQDARWREALIGKVATRAPSINTKTFERALQRHPSW